VFEELAQIGEQEGLVPDSTTAARFLPFLRRYGRALTGSQASGDAYVVATLEALVADPSLIDGDCGSTRRALPTVHQDMEHDRGQQRHFACQFGTARRA